MPDQASPDTLPPPASPAPASRPHAPATGFSCERVAVPESPPPYLAAGVLPFCVLGGDLLFLLGQQLRFRSRVRGASTLFPKVRGTSGQAAVGGASVKLQRSGASGESNANPPVRRPRRSPRPKLPISVPSPLFATAESSVPTPSRETVDEGASGNPAYSACKISPKVEKRARVAPLGSEGIGGSTGASAAAAGATVQRDESGADPPPDAAGPSAPQGSSRSRAEASRGTCIALQQGDSKGIATDGLPPPPAAVAATAEGDGGRQSSQSSEAPEEAPGQDSVPAGLLWSDFGGGREAGEDAEETASREFAEESFGIFHGVRLESDSVSRSQATMSSALRDPSLRGKRVFECRNGGYVMFIAEVNFVPDLMINLARKEILEGGRGESGAGDSAGGSRAHGQGRASSPGFSEKTDFAWVPASVLLAAMSQSRNRSTRKVVVKLGGCRYLRLFHKFVISLWGLDLAAVIKAASAPLHFRRPSIPRILLLQRDQACGHPDARQTSGKSGRGGKNAIRGIDCVRPSFLSGRKRTNLGIIEVRHEGRAPPGRWDSSGGGGCSGAGREGDNGAGGWEREPSSSDVGGEAGQSGGGRKARSKRSGAACRKRRRQCKKARQMKAAAVAAAAPLPPMVAFPGETAVEQGVRQADKRTIAESLVDTAVTEG